MHEHHSLNGNLRVDPRLVLHAVAAGQCHHHDRPRTAASDDDRDNDDTVVLQQDNATTTVPPPRPPPAGNLKPLILPKRGFYLPLNYA